MVGIPIKPPVYRGRNRKPGKVAKRTDVPRWDELPEVGPDKHAAESMAAHDALPSTLRRARALGLPTAGTPRTYDEGER